MKVSGLNHITIAVSSIEAAFAFYTEVLGFTPVMKSEVSAYMQAGGTWIALVSDEDAGSTNTSHLAFSIGEEEYPAMVRRLGMANVVEWKKNGTEGDSFYFLDPSGNKLEIHVGDLDSRIRHGKLFWENKVQWYD